MKQDHDTLVSELRRQLAGQEKVHNPPVVNDIAHRAGSNFALAARVGRLRPLCWRLCHLLRHLYGLPPRRVRDDAFDNRTFKRCKSPKVHIQSKR